MTSQMAENLCRLLQVEFKPTYYTYLCNISSCDFTPMYREMCNEFRFEKLPRNNPKQKPIEYGNCLSTKIDTMQPKPFRYFLNKVRRYFSEKYIKIDYSKFGLKNLK